MRLSVILSGTHPVGVAPDVALSHHRATVAAAHGRVDGVTLWHGWLADTWNPQALTLAAYLSDGGAGLSATVRGLPLGIVNPVELAEQLATVDHAWAGNFRASVRVGPEQAFAALGVDAARGPARFQEGLDIIRRMWKVRPMAGTGPQFRFSEVQPTLRPARPAGPPLSLEVTDETGLLLAGQLGLGVHLGRLDDPATADRLLRSWRTLGAPGEVSVEVDAADLTDELLATLARAGTDQVDVRLPTVPPEEVEWQVIGLARRREAIGR